ncbi:inner centromere protein A [Clinocottus analis]|uniref:inner centromere protein A n=1 Tax=Clinocottus analis TaxID=304258 RepID=UPI0035C09B8A
MNSVQSSVRSLMQMFDGKVQEFTNEIDNVHMVWLEEIQQEANRMFSRDFNAEPELMPKTPSQKKNSRRKRVSSGHLEENQARRRFSKGKRSNLRGSSVKSLNFIAEEETVPTASTSEATTTQPKRTTRKNKQALFDAEEDVSHSHGSDQTEEVQNKKPELVEEEEMDKNNKGNNAEDEPDYKGSTAQSPPTIPVPEVVVSISSSDRLSAELAKTPPPSPGRTAAKIAIAGVAQSSRRSSVRCSLKLRHSMAGLRHSMTQESVRRASRRSILKRKVARMGNSTCSSNVDEDSCMDYAEEEDREGMLMEAVSADMQDNAAAEEWQETPEIQINQTSRPSVGRITRSVAANAVSTPNKRPVAEKPLPLQSGFKSRQSTKRKSPDTLEESPTKKHSPPKKSQSAMRPNMRSFLHTVQKNQMLMMTPNSLGRTAVIKSFIKHNTPLKIDPKTKERYKLEVLKKKQEQEEERMKKMEEEKKKKQEELKRKRDERLRRVFEAKVKEEQRDMEKKKKIEQKMAQFDEKNDKRLADDRVKKKVALKRQEEQEQKRKLQQAEDEKRQQEFLAKKKAEEEEQRARKLAEARRALELKREQEKERELERERERVAAAAERERVEKEKALALQQELARAAREKERRDLEEKRKALEKRLEEEQRLAAEEKAAKEREAAAAAKKAADAKAAACLNVTVDIERSVMTTPVGKGGALNLTVDIVQSPQSYAITPKGGNKPLPKSKEDYGMDQNSDDSTDDESAPRKPIPSWAEGHNLQQIIMKQYFSPPDLDSFFGAVEPPKLENIFYKSKPRYFKRTSSAVWHSPPMK